MQLARAGGDPVMVKAREPGYFETVNLKHFPTGDEGYAESAHLRYLPVADSQGRRVAWATMLSEDASEKYGVLGQLTVGEPGKSGTHPADLYELYPDQRIKHDRRTWVYGPEDDPSDEDYPGGHVEVEQLGWLTPGEIEELQAKLETVEA